ncbi:class I SAM-dependent methyltransferase [Bacillaceae bacterium]
MDSEKAAVQNQFGRNAEAYVNSESHAKGRDLAKLVEISAVSSSDDVLDVATGGGHVANALAPMAAKVTALDLTRDMLEAARRFIEGNGHQNVEYVQGDAERMPFGDRTFDLVTCRIAPHHFPDVERFIEEVYRVLKPGGRFLLVDNVAPEEDEADWYYNEIEKRRDCSHFRAWKKSEWLRMLEKSGFVIEEWHRFAKEFPFETWCDRMKLPESEKRELSRFMLQAPEKIRGKLRIVSEGERIISFQGESILLKAVKPGF